MKLLLSLCAAAVGVVGFASTEAKAATVSTETLPSVAHINQVVVVETHRRHHYRHYHHRRYYYRHHRRYYY